ncbi:MAG: J domain-containing protein [Clostridiales bacterium]|nr:J domain-containing protein [Clostridiales bacterium]
MNPYKVLEIHNSASKDEIRKAYRNLARKYHPDSNPGNKEAEEKFKEINDAYAILSDEQKKEQYDREASMKKSSMNGEMFQQKTKQSSTKTTQPTKTSSNRAKSDFKMDKESIYSQFNDFFGFKM